MNGQTISSVIAWFNDNHALTDLLEGAGATFRQPEQRLVRCPFHDDNDPSLAVWRHQDNDKMVCHCFSQHSNCPAAAGAYLDAFDVHCRIKHLTPSEGVKQLVADHQLGRKRETVMVENPAAGQPADVTPDALAIHQEIILQARARLDDELAAAATRRGVVTAIRATPGLGKTHNAAELANRLQADGKTVAVFAPTLEMAQNEWLPRLKNGFVMRSKIDLCTCHEKALLMACQQMGYRYPHCTTPECPYARQAQQAFGKVTIFQHAHLTIYDFVEQDVLIVDESPASALLPERYATTGMMAGFLRRHPDDPAAPLVRAMQQAALALPETMSDVRGAALVAAIENHLDGRTLDQALERARQSVFNENMPDPPQLVQSMTPQFLGRLIDALESKNRAALSYGKSSQANKWCYVWHERATQQGLDRLNPPAILVLDGSADELVSRKLYEPWPVRFVDISCQISPLVELTQITCTASTRHVVRDERLIRNLADAVAVTCAQLGVRLDGGITYMGAVPILKDTLGGQWLHYGGQRGSNELAGASTVAIVATPTTPPAALERKSLALWPDVDCVWHKTGATGLYAAADQRLQAMNQLHALEELRQSIYRARPLTADKPMHLLVFSPWALDAIGLQPNRTITELPHGNSSAAKIAVEKYQADAGIGFAENHPTATREPFPIVGTPSQYLYTIGNDQKVAVLNAATFSEPPENPPPPTGKTEISRPVLVEPARPSLAQPSPIDEMIGLVQQIVDGHKLQKAERARLLLLAKTIGITYHPTYRAGPAQALGLLESMQPAIQVPLFNVAPAVQPRLAVYA